jgi:hypothetical protein
VWLRSLGGAQGGLQNGVYLCMPSRTPEGGSALLRDEASDDVFRWRLDQSLELGLSTEEAASLAESQADLAQARTALGGGCTRAVALRILL